MALSPVNENHALQIQAGTLGRNTGHIFEDTITQRINGFDYPRKVLSLADGHVFHADPAALLLDYVGARTGIKNMMAASALSTGALATSEAGKKWLSINGADVSRCKSDLVITLSADDGRTLTLGISTKQCNNKITTNAQLYFTTARAFASLLQSNGIPVSANAIRVLQQFCGDTGFRPSDSPRDIAGRLINPERYFWEELDVRGRAEWEQILGQHQDAVTRLLLQKAYLDDSFVPEYLLHKTKKAEHWGATEVAIYSIDELVSLSHAYQGFSTKPYCVRKGRYKDPKGISHLAPRFGVIQMQRASSQQHPTQLQFNLGAGYFNKI